MKTIHKYALAAVNNTVLLPEDSKVLLVGIQSHLIHIWIELDPEKETKVQHNFRVYPTGAKVPENFVHRGSIQEGSFVWHVYEVFL